MDVQQDLSSRSQNEIVKSDKPIEDPVRLFGQFVSAVTSDALKDIQLRSEFSTFVRDLCMKAPSVAQYLVQEILKHSTDNSEPEVQGPAEHQSGISPTRPSRRRKRLDLTYRLPKSSKTQAHISRDGPGDSHAASGSSPLVGDGSVTCQPGHDDVTINQSSDSLVTEKPLLECEGDIPEIVTEEVAQEGVQGQSSAHGRSLPSIGSESALHQLKATCSSDSAKMITVRPPLPSGAEQRGTALPEIDGNASNNQATSAPSLAHGTEPQQSTLPGPAPSTPVQQIGRGFQSPLSDDQTPHTALFTPIVDGEVLSPLTEGGLPTSPPDKVEMTLSERIPPPSPRTGQQQTSPYNTASAQAQKVDREQPLPTQDSQTILPPSPPRVAPALTDMVANAVHIIYEMSRRQEVPTEVHSRILSTLRPSLGEAPATIAVAERPGSMWIASSSTTWSASMWINMLEAGHARSKEATILNMIEWMGASEWYDAELEQAEKAPPPTKRGTPRKRLATVILDKYLKEARDTTVMESPGKLASEGNEDPPSSANSAGIQKRIFDIRRKRLNNILHRGRTLRKLIQMTRLGILFDPDIWSYAKGSKENIDKIAIPFRADPQKMELLSILDEQVELLAKEGRPDLSRFFHSLESHAIIPSEEVSSLRAEHGREREPVPQGCLDTAVARVVEGIGHVLGKHTLGNNDSIMVNGAAELSCGMFDRLRSRAWLNCWDIAAALEMIDRPVFVRLGLSVPLHKKDANGEVTPLSNPLRRWRKKIDDYKCEGQNDLEDPQVYICPLNINADHFTLLEINEQTKMIYHFDSMASHGIIYRKTKSTLVRRVVEEEFKYLSFGYTEAPTPQQRDGRSCGLMVIRNAKRRMIGLPVGSWDDEVDPDRVTKEVVGDCQTFLEGDALQPSPLSKKRKRIVEGLPNNVLKPSRSSKRLRVATEGS